MDAIKEAMIAQDYSRDPTLSHEELERLQTTNHELKAILREIVEVFLMSDLDCAAKYGPGVDIRELERTAVSKALVAIAKT